MNETAVLHTTARVGEGSTLGEYCIVGPNVRIGTGCNVGHHVVIHADTVIGNDVNLSARLCGAAAGGQTLISEATYRLVQDRVTAEELPAKHLKGIEENVRCWSVTSLS